MGAQDWISRPSSSLSSFPRSHGEGDEGDEGDEARDRPCQGRGGAEGHEGDEAREHPCQEGCGAEGDEGDEGDEARDHPCQGGGAEGDEGNEVSWRMSALVRLGSLVIVPAPMCGCLRTVAERGCTRGEAAEHGLL